MVRTSVFGYIERFCNRPWHSAIGLVFSDKCKGITQPLIWGSRFAGTSNSTRWFTWHSNS